MRKPLSRLEPAGLFFLVALTLSASAQGQAYARGSFILPYEVQWQGERVPAGRFLLSRGRSFIERRNLLTNPRAAGLWSKHHFCSH